jgi:hypothetical protein
MSTHALLLLRSNLQEAFAEPKPGRWNAMIAGGKSFDQNTGQFDKKPQPNRRRRKLSARAVRLQGFHDEDTLQQIRDCKFGVRNDQSAMED